MQSQDIREVIYRGPLYMYFWSTNYLIKVILWYILHLQYKTTTEILSALKLLWKSQMLSELPGIYPLSFSWEFQKTSFQTRIQVFRLSSSFLNPRPQVLSSRQAGSQVTLRYKLRISFTYTYLDLRKCQRNKHILTRI